MTLPLSSMYFVKVMHYEVVKCVKCGSISVVKTPLYKPIHTYPLVSFYDEATSAYDDTPIGEEEDCVFIGKPFIYNSEELDEVPESRWRHLLDYLRGQHKDKCREINLNDSYNCVDGICENCIKENNITIVFSKNNPIINYREAYEKLENILPQAFHAKKYSLTCELSGELLYEINPDAYNNTIRGNSPETLEERATLAKKYVELSKENIFELLKTRIEKHDFYAKAKSDLDEKTKKAFNFLQNAGRRVYRCKKIKYCSDIEWSKAKRCPFFPNAVVSDCEFYKLEERYNTEKNLIKINERNSSDILAGFEKEFDEFCTILSTKIAKMDIWN